MSSRCDERHTEIARHGRPRTGRGDIMATQRGIRKKEISATLQTVSALVCLSRHRVPLVFIPNRRCTDHFTFDRRIEISGPTTGIEGFQFWINGVSDFKLNLFIYLFVSISNNYFENRKFYSKSKKKKKN